MRDEAAETGERRLDGRFVWALLGYAFAMGGLLHWIDVPQPESVLDIAMAEMSPAARGGVMLAVTVVVVALALAAGGLVKAFWNRFLSSVFGWRHISFMEALALQLVWYLFFWGMD